MGQCFHQNRNCFHKPRTSCHVRFSHSLTCLLMELKLATQTCQEVDSLRPVKPADGHCIPFVNRIMNIENATKVIVKKFIDLLNVEKGLMYENQQPSSQQTL